MIHLQHVDALVGQHRQIGSQRVGLVRQYRGEAGNAPLCRQAVLDDTLQHGHIHIAAGQQRADGLSLYVDLAGHHRRHADGAGALGDELLLLQNGQDSGGDLALTDGDHLIHILAAHVKGQLAGRLDLNTVGYGPHLGQRDDLILPQRLVHAGGALRLYADHLTGRLQLFDSFGHAGDQSAAADGGDDHVNVRQLLQDLQTDGALTGHNAVVIERMNKGIALLIPQTDRLGIGVVVHAGHQHHLRAVAAGGLDLGQRCALGDTDDGVDPHVPGGIRHALGVVSGTAGDDTPALLLIAEGSDLVIRATQLECAGLLQAIRLQKQTAVLSDTGAGDNGRFVDDAGQYALGVVQHFHGQHNGSSLTFVREQRTFFNFLYFNGNTYSLQMQSFFR